MPDFTVVIPTCNRARSLAQLLQALAEQIYPVDDFEVIVVDDGGTELLDHALSGCGERLRITLLRQPNLGPASARNLGARHARGEYLAFIDDDCLPESGWLSGMEQALRVTPAAVCGGRTEINPGANLPTRATQLLMEYLRENYNPEVTRGAFYPTNNMAVSRESFLKMGGFDESLRFGEDREFCYRWQNQSRPFAYAPEAVVRHVHPVNVRSFLRLHYLYGRGTGRFRGVCSSKGLPRPGFSSPVWYLGLLGYGLKKERGWRGAMLSLLLASSQAASLAGVLSALAAVLREQK